MTDCYVLLNSGDFLLLNDGTSKVVLNSCEQVVAPTTLFGVAQKLVNPAPEFGQVELEVTAPIATTVRLGVMGSIRSKILIPVESRIANIGECLVSGRISDTVSMVTEGMIASKAKLKVMDKKAMENTVKFLKYIKDNIDGL